jgi:hypothetical protein
MYIYNVFISTFQFLTFWFHFSCYSQQFKCIFKFLFSQCCLLLLLLSFQFSYVMKFILLFNSLKYTSIYIYIPLFCAHISPLSSSLRSKEINAFNHTFWKGIRAKTFWYFFLSFLSSFFFLYLVISCFLNWFFFLISFGIIILPPILVLFQFFSSYLNKLQKKFSLIHSFGWTNDWWKIWIKVGL